MDVVPNATIEGRCEDAEKARTWVIPKCHADAESLRYHAAKGKLVKTLPGCFARPAFFESLQPRVRVFYSIHTLAKLHPNWVFCSYSAAALHGLWIANRLLEPLHILRQGSYSVSTELVVRHNMDVAGDEIVERDGVRTTCLKRTLLDCLCGADLKTALPMVDSALHWELATVTGLESYFATRGKGRRGIRSARRTLSLADGRSDSGGESVARAAMIELGFQIPDLQVEVFDPLEPGNPKYSDFGWTLSDGRVILGELDGYEKYQKAAERQGDSVGSAIMAMRKERRRESHINLTHATVIRFSMADVFDIAYFQRLLELAGVPKAA